MGLNSVKDEIIDLKDVSLVVANMFSVPLGIMFGADVRIVSSSLDGADWEYFV